MERKREIFGNWETKVYHWPWSKEDHTWVKPPSKKLPSFGGLPPMNSRLVSQFFCFWYCYVGHVSQTFNWHTKNPKNLTFKNKLRSWHKIKKTSHLHVRARFGYVNHLKMIACFHSIQEVGAKKKVPFKKCLLQSCDHNFVSGSWLAWLTQFSAESGPLNIVCFITYNYELLYSIYNVSYIFANKCQFVFWTL